MPTSTSAGGVICPICGAIIPETERFMLKWYAPKRWWVAYHLVPDPDGTSLEPYTFLSERFKAHCTRAGYNPATDSFK